MISTGPPVANDAKKPGAQTVPNAGDDQQKPDKLNSASSELSDLSEGNGSSLTHPTASEDADQAFDSLDEDESGTGSSDESEDNDDTPKHSEKATSREERTRFRNLLNKKLEEMFTKAKMELTPYGRIPWTKLGETLASHGCYVTGFPEGFAPRVTNDQLVAGTAPSTWSLNRTKPLLTLIENGTIRILPRPPGRRVLFELTRPDNTKYDSTIGYSSRWLHANMPSEFPAVKRSRSSLTAAASSKSSSRNDEASDWDGGSHSEQDDGSVAWKPHRKRPRLSNSRSPSLLKSLRKSRPDSSQPTLRSKREKPKPAKQEIKQGEKWKEGGIVKKVGRGWIVIEESTEEESTEKTDGQEGLPTEDKPQASTSRQSFTSQLEASRKRKHSAPPETPTRPTKRIHPEDSTQEELPSPTTQSDEKTLKMVVTRISKLIRDAGYTGSKKIPWSTLPSFLAQKKLYVTGFPYSCLPRIVNDDVKRLSSPPHWKPIQCTEMAESFNRNLVKILPRPAGRRVLFEAIGVDGKVFDSTLGYSMAWIETNIKEPKSTSASRKSSSPSKKSPSKQPNSTHSPRPSLKLVIPDTGPRLDSKPDQREKVTKPSVPKRTDEPKTEKAAPPDQKMSPIPRASIPTPIILLQPPTPLGGQGSPVVPAKLRLDDSPMVESPTAGRSSVMSNDQQAPQNLSPPPLPPPVDPVALPDTSSINEQNSVVQAPKRASFTFTIPPAKKTGRTGGLPESDNMSIDSTKGYNLDLMFESPSIENPQGGLPSHLQPKVSGPVESSGNADAILPSKGLPWAPTTLLRPGEEVVGTVQVSPKATVDSKYSIEKIVRPALVKLFDAAGLSSPGIPIPWVMLPLMLCQRRLFISGFPRHCLPKVVRDKVDGGSGPRGWTYPAYMAMLNALKAGEVRIKRRPRGRRVLFHLLPTDAQREEGDKHGTDLTLSFSQSWLDEHMVDDPNDLPEEDMPFEPSEPPIVVPRPRPLRRESSVWERFGKIKIEESESEDEERVPEPPWKIAMRELTRPPYEEDDSNDTRELSIPSGSSDGSEDDDDDDDGGQEPNLPLNHLLPSRIPHALQGKGRVILVKGDQFEWIPNNPYATDCPPERVIWCAIRSKWKLLSEVRDMDRWARGFPREEIPNRVDGKILGKGVCEHNATQKVWECAFVGRQLFGDLRWSPDLCAWEWILQDVDGRRKWPSRHTPDREYHSSHEYSMLSPMSI